MFISVILCTWSTSIGRSIRYFPFIFYYFLNMQFKLRGNNCIAKLKYMFDISIYFYYTQNKYLQTTLKQFNLWTVRLTESDKKPINKFLLKKHCILFSVKHVFNNFFEYYLHIHPLFKIQATFNTHLKYIVKSF